MGRLGTLSPVHDSYRTNVAAVTVDVVALTVRDDRLQVLLTGRDHEPYRGEFALPGGLIRGREDAGRAARRQLAEAAGLVGCRLYLEQLRTYSAPDRDPRGRVISVAHLAIAPDPPPFTAAAGPVVAWRPAREVVTGRLGLAFDHRDIVLDALERVRSKLEYTTLAAAFCPETFTIGDLRRVYEIVWEASIDPRNFHRKMLRTTGFLTETHERRTTEAGRPAKLYRCGSAAMLYPPMLRNGGVEITTE